MKKRTDTEIKILALLDKIRPFLISDGGNLEFVKYEDNIVYVRLMGACKDCVMMDITLKDVDKLEKYYLARKEKEAKEALANDSAKAKEE